MNLREAVLRRAGDVESIGGTQEDGRRQAAEPGGQPGEDPIADGQPFELCRCAILLELIEERRELGGIRAAFAK